MVDLILPAHMRSASHPFADLLHKKEDFSRVSYAIMRALARSFKEDASRTDGLLTTHTESEEKRRSRILFEWFRRLRGDLGYSVSSAIDELPRALRAELDGTPYEPPPKDRVRGVQGVQA
jgi:hypothetical protein